MLKFFRSGSSDGAKKTSSGLVILTTGTSLPKLSSCFNVSGSNDVNTLLYFTSDSMSRPFLSVFSTGSRKYVIIGAPVMRFILTARGNDRLGSVIITSGLNILALMSKYILPTPIDGHVITVKPSCL
ncbi:MAG: hypothetical protein IJR27_04640 [Synergistaceae bacterium]|nr:hypothetical protein [Synergistaceae bacterium]MBQ9574549.1 hypothetical protein [Synergistaceae bacterium]